MFSACMCPSYKLLNSFINIYEIYFISYVIEDCKSTESVNSLISVITNGGIATLSCGTHINTTYFKV